MYLLIDFGNKLYDEREIPISSINQITFWLRLDTRYFSSHQINTTGFSAIACVPPKPISQRMVKDIKIYSNKDFEGYPAGTNLAGLLYMKDHNAIEGYLPEYLAKRPKEAEGYRMTFDENAKPISGVHKFRVVYTNSSDKFFEMSREIDFQ